jgi:V8-like Glu-specific endopeptidase
MDTTLIAKILPTKKDGKRTIGTGYPIAKDLVLTARHVVIFPERNQDKPIVIEWADYKNASGDIYSVEAEIVFDGKEECDIAILKCQIPPQIQISSSVLARRFPIEHEKWAGFGYPRIGKDEDAGTRKKISVLGKFHPPDTTSHEITLTSESDALEKADWKGVSGAPVFQGTVLYAVISSTPTKRGECFTAVSIPYLLKNNEDFRAAIKQHINEAIDESKKNLHDKVKKEIAKILKNWRITPEELAEEWDLPVKTEDYIADYLVDEKKNTVKQAIIKLKKILEARKDSISETKQWNDCVKAAEAICGWLLIKSVNPAWWYEHEQKINQAVAHRLTLDEPAYIEVIISRSFLKCPQYKIDSITGKARPTRWNEDDDKSSSAPPRMIDTSDKAVKEQWLLSIYKDLHGENTAFIPIANKDYTTEILESIKSRAKTLYEDRDRLIYYIVPVDYFKQLESSNWVTECQEYLVGYLQFICCDKNEQSEQIQSTESQTELIEHLALLLKKKR